LPYGTGSQATGVNNASEVGFAIWCHAASCPPNDQQSMFGPAGSANVYSAVIQVNEPNAPSVSAGGNLWGANNTWISGTAPPPGGWNLSYGASDPAGVCALHPLLVDQGGNWAQWDFSNDWTPDFTGAAPCGQSSRGYSWSPAIGSLANGLYYLHVQATNPADAQNGNNYVADQAVALYVDNDPPPPVAGLSASSSAMGPLGWSSSPTFNLGWTGQQDYAGAQSPVTTTNLSVCGSSCVSWQQAASQTTAQPTVPGGAGGYTMSVWEQDQAGNQASPQSIALYYDSNPPGAPAFGPSRPSWIGADRVSVPETLAAAAGGPSGIYAYQVTVDRAPSGDWHQANVRADSGGGGSFDIFKLADGVHTLEAQAFSGAGVAGPVSKTTIRIDRQPPSTTISSDTPQAQTQWGNHPVTLSMSCADQPGLSGCRSVSYQLDGGPVQTATGSSTTLTVSSSGAHTLRAWSTDNAGNVGQAASDQALVDVSAPQGYFAPSDPNTPTQVVVDVADSDSGVAGGQIQMQQNGSWTSLPTSYDGNGHLTTAIADTTLPNGSYALRALVWDAAGNQATITATADGSAEVITLPLRLVTALHTGQAEALVRHCTTRTVHLRPIRTHGHRLRHQRPRTRLVRHCGLVPVPHSAGPLRLYYGQRATVRGLLETPQRQPISGAQVSVSGQAPGWTSQQLATLRTDGQGRFTYVVPAGPSRTLTFQFPGTATLRDSQATAAFDVVGKGTLRTSKRTIRAGKTLTLSGRIEGGYIPDSGKIVQLWDWTSVGGWQPFYRPAYTDHAGRWHIAFKTAAGARGYTFRFRAALLTQNGWPYLKALSPTVSVTIK
jgi:hypothetical protein